MRRIYGCCELIRPKLLTATGDADIYIGEREFVSGPGLYLFQVPLTVTRIHACCIGGGAQGGANSSDYFDDWKGGGGGGLGWKNNIEVTPGEVIAVQVGCVVGRNGDGPDGDSWLKRVDSNNDPIGDPLVAGNAPPYGDFYRPGGYIGDGGGNGGSGCSNSTYSQNGSTYVKNKGSGGGAGGYMGDGGFGVLYGGQNAGNGGAGSGGVSANEDRAGSTKGARGGGTGIKGMGASGASPRPDAVDFWSRAPQQPGLPGSGGEGPLFGAGGAGERDGWDGSDNTRAGHGAVRIIWGNRFSYPDNADVIE